jgi:hypothetical protein
MQLHIARLCLDCEEIHDQSACPICASESFAYISRWVPAPERRNRPRPVPSPEAAQTYRQLLDADRQPSGTMRWVRRGVFGVAALGMAGWVFRRNASTTANRPRETEADAHTSQSVLTSTPLQRRETPGSARTE